MYFHWYLSSPAPSKQLTLSPVCLPPKASFVRLRFSARSPTKPFFFLPILAPGLHPQESPIHQQQRPHPHPRPPHPPVPSSVDCCFLPTPPARTSLGVFPPTSPHPPRSTRPPTPPCPKAHTLAPSTLPAFLATLVQTFSSPTLLALQNHLGTLFPPSCLSRRLFSYSSIPGKTSPTASPPPVDQPLFLAAAAVQPSNHHAHVSYIVVDLPPPASGICLRRELHRLSAPRQPLPFPSRVYPAARPGATSETVAFGPAHSRLIGRGGLCTEGNNNARIYIVLPAPPVQAHPRPTTTTQTAEVPCTQIVHVGRVTAIYTNSCLHLRTASLENPRSLS
ncbi:hypothetical protein GQ607_012300 [Colletotrichum asianum]|uniref:Uncharacterized protein n=1 Tax=Colletotrichum asianum TaxID=702518 RepID=A0A8H3ZI20_9PEZI|nr:hypothetical protein GQ607_012300 [Colletotrichum asianum]